MSSAKLVRLDSKARGLEEEIRAQTQRFDVGIVFKLSLASKSLSSFPNLAACTNLLDLDLSNNSITRIENLEGLPQLKRLNLSSNRITQLQGLSHLSHLSHLNLCDNKLQSVGSLCLEEQLQPLTALRTLLLQHLFTDLQLPNSCCSQPDYKHRVLRALPQLTNLDGERHPGQSSYDEYSREFAAAVAQPPAKHEWVVPAVPPWLDEAQVATLSEQGDVTTCPEVEQHSKALVTALDKCHVLLEVLDKDMINARQLLSNKPDPG